MNVDSVSSQNTQRYRRRRKQLCQVVPCTKIARDEISIKTDIYDLVRLNVCKKCKKVFESKQTKNNLNTNRKTIEVDDAPLDDLQIMMDGADFDFRRHSWYRYYHTQMRF